MRLPKSIALKSFAGKGHTFGGDDRTRTDDPLRAKQVLSQLSYIPSLLRFLNKGGRPFDHDLSEQRWWARVGSNHRPHAYKACALTT